MTTNEKLAEVAGLKMVHVPVSGDIYHKNGEYYCYKSDWQPDQKIEQAMMVLQGWLDVDGYRSYSAYFANHSREHRIDLETTGENGAEIIGTGIKTTFAQAICKAVEEAIKQGASESGKSA